MSQHSSIITLVLLITSSLLCGCSSTNNTLNTTKQCDPGRTSLDGTCVSNEVADYITCVRSQNVEISTEAGNSFSTSVGYIGIGADAASEVSEKLRKKYTASDAVILNAIQKCDNLAGLTQKKRHPTPTNQPQRTAPQQSSDADMFTVDLFSCRRSSGTVACSFTVTNNGGGNDMYIYRQSRKGATRIFSPTGKVTNANKIYIGDTGGNRTKYGYKMPEGIPVKGTAEFRNYDQPSISLLEIQLSRTVLHNPTTATFKSIDVE